ncbi:MAG: hypothetical protein OHK0013_45080 [Sandaracinaceae bacterium]
MPRFVIRTEGPAPTALREALERAAEMLCADEVNLNELGRALHAVMAAAGETFRAAGLPSVRMDAAEKALDLRTAKSALERFVRGGA